MHPSTPFNRKNSVPSSPLSRYKNSDHSFVATAIVERLESTNRAFKHDFPWSSFRSLVCGNSSRPAMTYASGWIRLWSNVGRPCARRSGVVFTRLKNFTIWNWYSSWITVPELGGGNWSRELRFIASRNVSAAACSIVH